MNMTPYTLPLLQIAALNVQAHHSNLQIDVVNSHPGPSLRLNCKDTKRGLSFMNAGPYVSCTISEPYGKGHVHSYYWAASEGKRSGFSGLGLQLDLPTTSVKFDGTVEGNVSTGVVRLRGSWTTFGRAQDNDFPCYWDIDVRNTFLDEPDMEARVGRSIYGCLQQHLAERLKAISLEMPSGIASFDSALQLLFAGNYFGSVSKLLTDSPVWVGGSSTSVEASPSP